MSFKKNPTVFTIAMCAYCALFLIVASFIFNPLRARSEKIERQKNILKAMGGFEKGHVYSGFQVQKLYRDNITEKWLTPSGNLTNRRTSKPIYVLEKNGEVKAYAIPISGHGLWSNLSGYIAIRGDGATIQGFTIDAENETPRLGGQVEKGWFQKQFQGKKIVDETGAFVSVGVLKGRGSQSVSLEQAAHYVDGISGATVTSKALSVLLKKNLTAYELFSKKLRDKLNPPPPKPQLPIQLIPTENLYPTENVPEKPKEVEPTQNIYRIETYATDNYLTSYIERSMLRKPQPQVPTPAPILQRPKRKRPIQEIIPQPVEEAHDAVEASHLENPQSTPAEKSTDHPQDMTNPEGDVLP